MNNRKIMPFGIFAVLLFAIIFIPTAKADNYQYDMIIDKSDVKPNTIIVGTYVFDITDSEFRLADFMEAVRETGATEIFYVDSNNNWETLVDETGSTAIPEIFTVTHFNIEVEEDEHYVEILDREFNHAKSELETFILFFEDHIDPNAYTEKSYNKLKLEIENSQLPDNQTIEKILESIFKINKAMDELVFAKPSINSVTINQTTFKEGESLVLTVIGSDEHGLKKLEVDHSLEDILPEFSVYGLEGMAYGDENQRNAFDVMGVTVDYSETTQTWVIDFGSEVTKTIIQNGGITFYFVLENLGGNTYGSMYEVDSDNTFEFDLKSAPEIKSVTGNEEAVKSGENFILTVVGSDLRGLRELEVDHNLANILQEFSVYGNELNPYDIPGTEPEDEFEEANFAAAGVVVTYSESTQTWVIDFGPTVTDVFIQNGGITFYLVLKNVDGEEFGSMYEVTEDNTYSFTLTRD